MFFLTLGTSELFHLSATLVPIVSKIIFLPSELRLALSPLSVRFGIAKVLPFSLLPNFFNAFFYEYSLSYCVISSLIFSILLLFFYFSSLSLDILLLYTPTENSFKVKYRLLLQSFFIQERYRPQYLGFLPEL